MITTSTHTILCNHCTSTFNVPVNQQYTSCPTCGTHLMIEETDQAISTLIISKQDIPNTPVIVNTPVSLSLGELQNELQLLQDEWKITEDGFKKFKNNKNIKALPSKSRAAWMSIGGSIMAIGFYFLLYENIPLAIMGFAWAVQGVREWYFYRKYKPLKDDYTSQLNALKENIRYLERGKE